MLNQVLYTQVFAGGIQGFGTPGLIPPHTAPTWSSAAPLRQREQWEKQQSCTREIIPPDETWHCCETTFDNLTSALSAAGVWAKKTRLGEKKNPLIWTVLRARSKAAFGIWTRTASRGGAGSCRWLGLSSADKAASMGWERIHPAASNSIEDFKDREVDELQLYSPLQQLLIRWALSHCWHLINVPPCVEVLQQEGDGRGFWLSWWQCGSRKQFSCQSASLLAFTKGGNTFTYLLLLRLLFDVSNSIFT